MLNKPTQIFLGRRLSVSQEVRQGKWLNTSPLPVRHMIAILTAHSHAISVRLHFGFVAWLCELIWSVKILLCHPNAEEFWNTDERLCWDNIEGEIASGIDSHIWGPENTIDRWDMGQDCCDCYSSLVSISRLNVSGRGLWSEGVEWDQWTVPGIHMQQCHKRGHLIASMYVVVSATQT